MSAPDVNVERQKRRHHTMVRGLWIGGVIAAVVAVTAFIATGVFGVDATEVVPPAGTGDS